MSDRYVASILLVFLCGNLFAADFATVSKWTNELAVIFEREVRSGLDQPFYANQLVGLDRDSVAQQIGHKQANCWVGALMRLAERYSIKPEDIFVGLERGIINTDLFPDREVNRETADCAQTAFESTGIYYNNDVER